MRCYVRDERQFEAAACSRFQPGEQNKRQRVAGRGKVCLARRTGVEAQRSRRYTEDGHTDHVHGKGEFFSSRR